MTAMNFFGKTVDTVDFGTEADYAAYEWFKGPPPQRVRGLIFACKTDGLMGRDE
jgi:hypothetical protein